jgi:hypothetical protein
MSDQFSIRCVASFVLNARQTVNGAIFQATVLV